MTLVASALWQVRSTHSSSRNLKIHGIDYTRCRDGDGVFEAMKRRGLTDRPLVTSIGAPGIIKAIEIAFRTRLDSAAGPSQAQAGAQLPEEVWPEFKVRPQAGR